MMSRYIKKVEIIQKLVSQIVKLVIYIQYGQKQKTWYMKQSTKKKFYSLKKN